MKWPCNLRKRKINVMYKWFNFILVLIWCMIEGFSFFFFFFVLKALIFLGKKARGKECNYHTGIKRTKIATCDSQE